MNSRYNLEFISFVDLKVLTGLWFALKRILPWVLCLGYLCPVKMENIIQKSKIEILLEYILKD